VKKQKGWNAQSRPAFDVLNIPELRIRFASRISGFGFGTPKSLVVLPRYVLGTHDAQFRIATKYPRSYFFRIKKLELN